MQGENGRLSGAKLQIYRGYQIEYHDYTHSHEMKGALNYNCKQNSDEALSRQTFWNTEVTRFTNRRLHRSTLALRRSGEAFHAKTYIEALKHA